MGVLQNAVSVVWLYDLASVVDDSLWLQFSAKEAECVPRAHRVLIVRRGESLSFCLRC